MPPEHPPDPTTHLVDIGHAHTEFAGEFETRQVVEACGHPNRQAPAQADPSPGPLPTWPSSNRPFSISRTNCSSAFGR